MSARDVLQAIAARAAAATQGPWRWGGNTDSGDVYLAGRGKVGAVEVLGTVPVERTADDPEVTATLDVTSRVTQEDLARIWTQDPWTQETREDRHLCFLTDSWVLTPARDLAVYEVARAQGLPDDTPRDYPQVYRADVVDVRHPDAAFIAAARTDVPRLAAALADVLDVLDTTEAPIANVLRGVITEALDGTP